MKVMEIHTGKDIDVEDKGSTDKFGTTILTHLFCPHFGGKSSTEHHAASGFPPRSDEKIYANLADLILSVFPKIMWGEAKGGSASDM